MFFKKVIYKVYTILALDILLDLNSNQFLEPSFS